LVNPFEQAKRLRKDSFGLWRDSFTPDQSNASRMFAATYGRRVWAYTFGT